MISRITRRRMKTNFIIVLFFALHPIIFQAQSFFTTNGIRFEQLQIKDGLPQNSVTAILQDRQGFIWLGTPNGLAKYDGYEFQTYKPISSDPFSIQGKDVTALFEDETGNIWIGTSTHGVNCYDPKSRRFFNFRHSSNDPNSLTNNNVTAISQDRSGAIVVGTKNGLNRILFESSEWFETARIQTYFPPTLPDTLYTFVDSLCRLGKNLAKHLEVRNNQDLNTSFQLWNRAQVLVLAIGQKKPSYPNGFADQGWIEKGGGRVLWQMDISKTYDAEAPLNGEFRVQAEVISLDKGIYQLKYKSNEFAAYGDWANNEIAHPKQYGIQVISLNEWEAVYLQKLLGQQSPYGSVLEQVIEDIYTDEVGNTWIGGGGGLTKMTIPDLKKPEKPTFEFYQPLKGKPGELSSVHVHSISPSKLGGLWIGGLTYTRNSGWGGTVVEYFDLEKQVSYDLDHPIIGYNLVKAIHEVEDGSLWTGVMGVDNAGSGGLVQLYPRFNQGKEPYRIPTEKETFFHFKPEYAGWSALTNVNEIIQDFSGATWIATNNHGLIKYTPSLNRFPFKELHAKNVEGSISPASLIEDKNGMIWVGSEKKGLFIYNFENNTLDVAPNLPRHLEKATITDLEEDPEGNIWLSTKMGRILKINPDNYQFQQFPLLSANFHHFYGLSISDLEWGERGNLWVSSNLGLIRVYPQRGKFEMYYCKPIDKRANCSGIILQTIESADGNLWLATDGHGLQRISKTVLEEKKMVDTAEVIIPNQFITHLHEDKRGRIWAGTFPNGFFLVKEDGSYQNFTEQNGLLHDHIYSIQEDTKERIWLTTPRGWSRFSLLEDSFTNFTEKDGLEFSQMTTSPFITTKNGYLVNGGVGGFYRFRANNFELNLEAPKLAITEFKVLDQVRPFREEGALEFKHFENDVFIKYVGLHFGQPIKNQYRYRLLNSDERWIEGNAERVARFTNLSPGSYTFEFTAANSDGIWNKKAAILSFTILPPWWKTWWAYLIYTLLTLGLLYKIYQFQLSRKLEHAEASRLKELNETKSRLYTNITHEFRTPLTIILGMAEQIKSNPNKWLQEGVGLIQKNGENLLHLVNQMLSLAKIESGAMPMNVVRGEVVSYLKYLLESFHSFAESKNIQLSFSTEISILEMDYDEEKLKNVFTNLISNAIKYTPSGGSVKLELKTLKTVGTNHLQINLSDTGIGIPKEKLLAIFDRFYQVDDSTTRKEEGTGIGLAITKELVQLMGGKINVESVLGGGTTFKILLPVKNEERGVRSVTGGQKNRVIVGQQLADAKISIQEPSSSSKQAPIQSTIHPIFQITNQQTATNKQQIATSQKSNPPTILIIEDNQDVTRYLSACLSEAYQTVIANNGKVGLDMAFGMIPDLIISDVMMPEVDGFLVCKQLKADERTKHIPIVLLTARGDMDSKLEGLDMGADAYLAKPFYPDELKIRITKLLELRQQLREHYLQLAGLTPKLKGVEQKVTPEDKFVIKVREIIEHHLLNSQFNIELLAKEAGVSLTQLHRKLKGLLGISANQLVRSIRLSKAKQLLQESQQNITEIAYEVGFNDPDYFSRVFKKEFNCSPTQFREKIIP